MICAGRSDKYGQVSVERVGNTGFDDPDEPVALLRAQDEYAYAALRHYHERLQADPRVPAHQLASVRRQLHAFAVWRSAHGTRVPGTRLRVLDR